MNENLLKIVLSQKKLFIPLIFTDKQFLVIEKYQNKKKLSNAEKKAFYTSIKKKLNALSYLCRDDCAREYFLQGREFMISSRVEEAKKIIKYYCKKYEKVFVSGSFLFSEKYEDVDVFIIKKKGYSEKFEGKKHLIFLTKKRLTQAIFQSASLISVSNFLIKKEEITKRPKLSELMSTYHEAVIELIRKEKKPESARRLIFDYSRFCKKKLLNPKELYEETKKLNVKIICQIIKEVLKQLFSRTYLYVALHNYLKILAETINNVTPNFHLEIFKKTYEEMIYGFAKS
ncbi:hypothetical protein COV11_02750 [Candidatus Woesearchaeota archaeon CG10_big_fil_rev_8_21_14_0_10_30_7]|nr:MAG: hypothetical protein COV11_02750 [Candidatus Woesearchaeota archaeon CG10_big_fil_rev_8_21_14_0_10_30_7]